MTLIKQFARFLWDFWCCISILGIWPRFIEPRLLKKKTLTLELANLPLDLEGLKIVHFSDLHLHLKASKKFLKKITTKINKTAPDIVVFTGDFICYSRLEQEDILNDFLNSFYAPYGCYCIFGNHDYQSYVSLNNQGNFDIAKNPSLFKGLRLLMKKKIGPGQPTVDALKVPFHEKLCNLIEKTPFQLLENVTQTISIKNSHLNICGLGDLWLGRCRPETAFAGYNSHFPGIILVHNPQGYELIKNYPGEIILSGHTHGEQVHFPGWFRTISKKLAGLSKNDFSRGLYEVGSKKIYVSRGVGCHKPFRLGSTPEFLLITLKKASK